MDRRKSDESCRRTIGVTAAAERVALRHFPEGAKEHFIKHLKLGSRFLVWLCDYGHMSFMMLNFLSAVATGYRIPLTGSKPPCLYEDLLRTAQAIRETTLKNMGWKESTNSDDNWHCVPKLRRLLCVDKTRMHKR